MWDELIAAAAAFVPRTPARRHWWSLPRVAVTTAEILQPLDDQLRAIFRKYGVGDEGKRA